MHTLIKVAVVGVLMVGIGSAVVLKHGGNSMCCPGHPGGAHHHDAPVVVAPSPSGLPRLVELGSTTCIPCQMMKPVIEELTAEYDGRLEVVFVDVQQDPEQGHQYNVKTIPTQVFLDPSGKELFRHVGVISKEDILAKWEQLGFEF